MYIWRLEFGFRVATLPLDACLSFEYLFCSVLTSIFSKVNPLAWQNPKP